MLVCEVCGKTVVPGKDFSPMIFLLQLGAWMALGSFIGVVIGFFIVVSELPESGRMSLELGRADKSIIRDLTWMFAAAFGFIVAVILTLSNLAQPPTICPLEIQWRGKHHVYKEYEPDLMPEKETYD